MTNTQLFFDTFDDIRNWLVLSDTDNFTKISENYYKIAQGNINHAKHEADYVNKRHSKLVEADCETYEYHMNKYLHYYAIAEYFTNTSKHNTEKVKDLKENYKIKRINYEYHFNHNVGHLFKIKNTLFLVPQVDQKFKRMRLETDLGCSDNGWWLWPCDWAKTKIAEVKIKPVKIYT